MKYATGTWWVSVVCMLCLCFGANGNSSESVVPSESPESFRYRGAVLGGDCKDAESFELEHGLRRMDAGPDANEIRFKDLESSLLVILSCKGTTLFNQLVMHRFTNEVDARKACSAEYEQLTSTLGAPEFDLIRASLWTRLRLWAKGLWAPDVLRAAQWSSEKGTAMLSCPSAPAAALADQPWSVQFSQSLNPGIRVYRVYDD
jgi:hypothetical protein